MVIKVAAGYAAFGVVWVLLSDRVLDALVSDPVIHSNLQTLKGWLFVLLSTVLVYYLARAVVRQQEAAIKELGDSQQALRRTLGEVEGLNRAQAKSQKEYERLFSANPQPMWIYDPETLRFLAVNDAAVSHYGYPRDEWLGMKITDIRPEKEVSRLLENVKRSRREPFSETDLWTHRKRDGSLIEVEISAHSIQFNERAARVVTAIDVTEQVRLRRAIAASEKRYRSLFENNHAVMLLIDPTNGRIVDANPAAVDYYGYPWERLTAMRISDINTLSADQVKAEMERARRAERSYFRFQHRLAHGEVREVEVYSGTVESNGTALLYSIVHDVTDKHQAEKALQDAEERYRALIEQSVVGTYVVDGDVFSYASPRMEEIFGYGPGEMAGLRVEEIVTTGDRSTVTESISQRLSGDVTSARYQFRGQRKNGGALMIEVHGTVAWIGGRKQIVGVLNDVTEQVESAAREREHLRRIEEAMRGTVTVVDRMVELRDPYTAGHERRVAEIVEAIGREMRLSPQVIEGLCLGASIHDIGKISIPTDILAKPGKLTKIEYEYVQYHATAGYELLKGIPFPWPLAEMVYQHHERLDGSGYPRGLRGDQILLEARILAVADVVEAMASHRPYRPSRGFAPALEEIERNAGNLYDPEVVGIFLKLVREKGYRLPEV